jgi:hypothetical protein
MKILKTTILLVTITSNVFSQFVFEKGYFIDNTDKKVSCYIKNLDWLDNPSEVDIKIDSLGTSTSLTVNDIKEFEIYNEFKFVRAITEIDTTIESLEKLVNDKKPYWVTRTLFLKVLVEGKANLYYYEGNELIRYFFNVDNNKIKQLVHKKYLSSKSEIVENNMYLGQLSLELNCYNNQDLKRLKYQNEELVDFFIKYNKCNAIDSKIYIKKSSQIVHLKIVAGANISSAKIEAENEVNFGVVPSFLIGFETEYIVPFNKKRWSVILEPYFGYYKTSKKFINILTQDYNDAEIDFKYFDILGGFRFSHIINNNLKIHLTPYYHFYFPINSFSTMRYVSSTSKLDITWNSSYAIGLGVTYRKYCVEFKYFNELDLVQKYIYINSSFNNQGFSVKYTLF